MLMLCYGMLIILFLELVGNQALLYISTKGVPPVRNASSWSHHFHDFMSVCLDRNKTTRATTAELLKVRWLPFPSYFI